jgi:hypothetical protein
MNATYQYLKQAKFELKAVKPEPDGRCITNGQFPTPCYNTDGVRSYTCSTAGYKSNKIACDKCDINVRCPTGPKGEEISNSCSGIGGEMCSNSGSVEPDTPSEPDTPTEPDTLTNIWTKEEKDKVKKDLMTNKDGVSLQVADCIVSFISKKFNYDYYENMTNKEDQESVVQNIKTCIEKFKESDNSKISPLLIIGIVLISICIAGGLYYLYKYIKSSAVSSSAPSSSAVSSSAVSSSAPSSSAPSSSAPSSSAPSSSAPQPSFRASQPSIVSQPSFRAPQPSFRVPQPSIVSQPSFRAPI